MLTRRTQAARPGLEALEPRQLFATTALDPSFGTNGLYTQDLGAVHDAKALAIQRDGRIVVAGGERNAFYTPGNQTVFRLLPNGIPDASFTSPSLPTGDYDFFEAIVQDDGKILLSGAVRVAHSTTSFLGTPFVARLNSDGSLDSSFSTDGLLNPIDDTREGYVSGLAVLPDGKILFSGGIGVFLEDIHPFVGRLLEDGTLDPSYGQNGGGLTRFDATAEHFGGYYSVLQSPPPNDLALLPDGRIILTGVYSPDEYDTRPVLARLTADGQRDVTFGSNGIKPLPATSTWEGILSITTAPDGKLVGAGYASYDAILWRFDVDGNLDPSFGNGGRVLLGMNPSINKADRFQDVEVGDDGRIFAGGNRLVRTRPPKSIMTLLASFLPDGTKNPEFNGGVPDVSRVGRVRNLEIASPTRVITVGGPYDLTVAAYGVGEDFPLQPVPSAPPPSVRSPDERTELPSDPTMPPKKPSIQTKKAPPKAPAPKPQPAPAARPPAQAPPSGGTDVPTTPVQLPSLPLAESLVTTFPPSLVSGTREKGSAALQLRNQSVLPFAGVMNVRLVLSTDTTVDASDFGIGDQVATVKLAAGAAKRLVVKVPALPSVPDGTYHVLAYIERAGAPEEVIASGTPITFAAPSVQLHASAVVIRGGVSGRAASASVEVQNLGNIAARGVANVTLQTSAGVVVATIPAKLTLSAGQKGTVRLKLPSPFEASANDLPLTAVLSLP